MGVRVKLVVGVDDGIAPYSGPICIDALIWLQDLWYGGDQGDKILLQVLKDG